MSVTGAADRRARDAAATVLHAQFLCCIEIFCILILSMYVYIYYMYILYRKRKTAVLVSVYLLYIYIYIQMTYFHILYI